jgi:hypothetical protein
VGDGGPGRGGGMGDLDKVFGEGLELVSVRHPDLARSWSRSNVDQLVCSTVTISASQTARPVCNSGLNSPAYRPRPRTPNRQTTCRPSHAQSS